MAPETGDDIVTPPIARGALTHRFASAVALRTTALTGRLDLFTYRSILAVPTWGCITAAVVATRAYVTGLEAGLTLLQMTEVYRACLTPSEGAAHRRALYLFILDMLDRSDEWDGYLTAWEQIRTHTDDALRRWCMTRHWHCQVEGRLTE